MIKQATIGLLLAFAMQATLMAQSAQVAAGPIKVTSTHLGTNRTQSPTSIRPSQASVAGQGKITAATANNLRPTASVRPPTRFVTSHYPDQKPGPASVRSSTRFVTSHYPDQKPGPASVRPSTRFVTSHYPDQKPGPASVRPSTRFETSYYPQQQPAAGVRPSTRFVTSYYPEQQPAPPGARQPVTRYYPEQATAPISVRQTAGQSLSTFRPGVEVSQRLAAIDRIRDRALETGDVSLLKRADALEKTARQKDRTDR